MRAGQPRQPALGLLGLTFVVPIAVGLAVGAGAEGSVRVFAPLITYSLPLVVMIAFWWEDWPGTRTGPNWAGWADTLLIAAGAVVLTGVGQAVAGRVDIRGLVDPRPGPGHFATFPATMPLGGAVFVAMLQLTLVGEGWPLRGRLRPLPAGLLAVAISWAVGLVVLVTLVRPDGARLGGVPHVGPVPAAELGAGLVLVGAWQVLCGITLRGWPFAVIPHRGPRVACAHLGVIGGGFTTYVIVRLAGAGALHTAAVAGCFVAAGLLTGMLLEGLLGDRDERVRRSALLAATAVLTAVLVVALEAVARTLHFASITADDWVEHAALNALSTSVLLHVAIGRRWPFVRDDALAGRR